MGIKESAKKALANWKREPYFQVEMKSGSGGAGMTVRADWNDFFITHLDGIGYGSLNSDEDKVDAYIRACYFSAARQEGADFIDTVGTREEDE